MRLAIVLLVTCWTFVACDGGRDSYVGRWQSTANAADSMRIEKNGESYLVIGPDRSQQEKTVPARLVDGMLRIESGLGGGSLSYIEKSKTLIATSLLGSQEYRRMK